MFVQQPINKDAISKHMKTIEKRMELGLQTYGHGIRVSDDTRKWGTCKDSWLEMAEEEILDALIYSAADILRKQSDNCEHGKQVAPSQDCNEEIKELLKTTGKYKLIDNLWQVYNLMVNMER